MFDIGFGELLLIGLVGLLVLGPERLPGVAKTLGGFVRKARRTWNQMRVELEQEVDRSRIQDIKNEMTETRKQLRETVKSADQSLRNTGDQLKETVDKISETASTKQSADKSTPPSADDSGS